MKIAFTTALLAFLGISAQAQTRKMWVNTNTASLREKPAPTSHAMLKLGAPAEVTVISSKGQWVQVMFSPYEGGTSWAGWMDGRSLVANRDSVKVPASAALFTVPSDEKVYPRTSGVKGVPGYHRTFQVR